MIALALVVLAAAAPPDFARDVAPIFEEHCLKCHSASSTEDNGGLLMDDYESLMKGGDHGDALVPGRSEESRLVLMIERKVKPKMPPKGELPAAALAVLKAWIDAGAEPSVALPAAGMPDLKPLHPRPAPVYGLAWSPDGALLAVGGHRQVRLLDAATGAERRTLAGPASQVRSLGFSRDGRWLAAGGGSPARSGEVVLFDLVTGEVARTLRGHRDAVHAAAFSPDGGRLVTSSYDKTVRLWHVASGRQTAKLEEHTDAVFPVAWSPDGLRVVSGAGDRTVKVWDAATGRRIYTLTDALDTVYAVAFRPDGAQLAAAGADKVVRMWRVADDGAALAFSAIAHEDVIVQLAYTPDGKRMVTAAADGVVKLWAVDPPSELRLLPRQPDWPTALAVSPDGSRVAIGRYDGSAALYDLETGRVLADLTRPAAAPARSSRAAGTGRGR